MDKLKLEFERKKRNITVDDFCKQIGISRSAYYRKCNGTSEFTQKEIQRIMDILGLRSPIGIFFKEKCLKWHKEAFAIWLNKLISKEVFMNKFIVNQERELTPEEITTLIFGKSIKELANDIVENKDNKYSKLYE